MILQWFEWKYLQFVKKKWNICYINYFHFNKKEMPLMVAETTEVTFIIYRLERMLDLKYFVSIMYVIYVDWLLQTQLHIYNPN